METQKRRYQIWQNVFFIKSVLTKFNSLHRKPKIIKATKENTSSIIIQSIKTKTSKPQGIVYGSDT